jgi:gliding motility-associated protein GldM
MAGGKETPRQKMVGLMYLVLTALLALQVSNTILDKFVFIDDSLQYSVDITRKNTDKQIKGGAELVEKQGNSPKDVALLKKAEEVKKKSDEVYAYITKVREDLIKMTGGKDEKGGYVGAKNDNEVMLLMLGDVSKGVPGEAKKMKETLNNYAKTIAAMDSSLKDLGEPIAVDAKDMPMYKNNSEQNTKDFGLITFDQTPTVAALAILSDLEAKVARVETKAVDKIISQIGGVVVKFDKILAMASAESQTVAAGTKYRAKMFISASSTQIKPSMRVSQGSVNVKGDVGEVEFTAPPATDYNDQGLAKRKWQGSITIKKADGQDTTFKFDQEYFIAKPVIKVQSGNVSALYLNCGNDLQIDVPALGASYDPSFTATGGEVIKGGKVGSITVVPNAANLELGVSSGGNKIGTEKFKVKLLPKPEIKIMNGGKEIDQKQGGACPRSLRAVAVAEASVKDAVPKDARYKVTEWEITLARGKRAIGGVQKLTSDEAGLTNQASQAQAGDRLVIEVKSVERMNFRNAREKVTVGSQIFTYPIN